MRRALLHVKQHLPPSNTSGLGDVSGRGSGAPLDGTSLVLMSAQMCGPGIRAEHVTAESVDRICLSRAPHIHYRNLLSNGAQSLGRSWEYFRRVAKETGSALVRAVAQGRELIRESIRISFTSYGSPRQGLAPPGIRLEGSVNALGILRSLSRIVKDGAHVEAPVSWVFDACSGCLPGCNLPLSKAFVAPVAPEVFPPLSVQPPRASRPDGMVSGQTKAVSPPVSEGRFRSRGAPRLPRTRFSETPRHVAKSDDRLRRSRSRSREQASGDPTRIADKFDA